MLATPRLRSRRGAISSGIAGVLACVVGCSPPSGETTAAKPAADAIILISIDTLRSDHLPAYGYGEVDTPAIDRLVKDGVLFEHAYSPIPLTLPAHASILTGLLPNEHGVRDNLGFELRSKELPYLPRLLRDAGYATGAAVSSLALAGRNGLAEGFDFYDDEIGERGARSVGEAQRAGAETLERVLGWIDTVLLDTVLLDTVQPDTVEGRPFFLFFHLYEPHTPYLPPAPFDDRYASPYDGEIATADAIVGQLLEALQHRQLYDRAAIVLTSDHGEGLGEHGEREHGMLLYREALQVPLVIKLPEQRFRGRRVESRVQLSDLFATIAELAGVQPELEAGEGSGDGSGDRGQSLLAAISGNFEERAIYAESSYGALSFGWSELVSVILGDRHYVEARGPRPAGELFDLVADAGETTNLVRRERRQVAQMRSLLSDYAWGTSQPDSRPRDETSEARQALQALGYLSGGREVEAPGEDRPDPRTEVDTLESMMNGLEQFRAGDLVAAERSLRTGLEKHPQLVGGWEHLARAIAGQGRGGEVLEVYREALAATGSSELAQRGAELLIELGELDGALDLVREELERTPQAPALGSLEVRLLLARGAVGEAARRAAENLAQRPADADAHYDQALASRSLGDQAAAQRALERAVELDPRHVDALNDLSVVRARSGRVDEAITLAERALAASPGHPLAEENLQSFRQLRR